MWYRQKLPSSAAQPAGLGVGALGATITLSPDAVVGAILVVGIVLALLAVVGLFAEKYLVKPAFSLESVPALRGKTAVVTGGQQGIGFEVALALAKKGARVIIASPSERHGSAAVDSIRDILSADARDKGQREDPSGWPVEFAPLDLANLESIRAFARAFGDKPLHLLVNAAEMTICPFELTDDNYEMQIGHNHLGHFCLTALLTPALSLAGASTSSRVVFVTNDGHHNTYPAGVDFGSLSSRAGYDQQRAHGQSKLCNILAAYKFAKRLGHCGVLVNAVNPGPIDLSVRNVRSSTDFASWGPFAPLLRVLRSTPLSGRGVAEAALTVVWAAASPDVAGLKITGKYIVPPGQLGVPSAHARDVRLAKRVWDWSVEACGIKTLPEPLREKFSVDDGAMTALVQAEPKAAERTVIDAEDVNKLFVWMGVSPSLNSPCGASLYKHFPGALPGSAVSKRVAAILREFGVTPGNSLYGQSICSDEINNEKGDLATLMQDYWGDMFPLGGIGGAPYAGKTGFGAFSHHVQHGQNVVVLYGPHIAVSEAGELGKYLRVRQDHHSDACGAVMAAYRDCCKEATTSAWTAALAKATGGSTSELDMQQSWLRNKVRPSVHHIQKAKVPYVELTHTIYKSINEYMHNIVNHDFGGKLVLIGGIQINLQAPWEDHFLPLTFEVSSKHSAPISLLPKLHIDSPSEKAAD